MVTPNNYYARPTGELELVDFLKLVHAWVDGIGHIAIYNIHLSGFQESLCKKAQTSIRDCIVIR